MGIKPHVEYIAGIVAGSGLLLFLLALGVDAGLLAAEGLKGAGVKFAGLALILAGSGMKWRARSGSKTA